MPKNDEVVIKKTSFNIEEKTIELLDKMAKANGRSMSKQLDFIIKEAAKKAKIE